MGRFYFALSASAAFFAFSHSAVAGPPVRVAEGEYLIKLKSSATATLQGKLMGKGSLKAAFDSKGSYHISTKDAGLIQNLKNDPDVEYVEPNFILQSIEPEVNSDKLTAQAINDYDQTGAPVKATEAWSRSSAYDPGNRPIVAIVDTGLDKTHYVFENTGALWVNPGEIPGNGIDDDFNGYVDDVSGWNFLGNNSNFMDDENHGTHVAGIVLGATQNIIVNDPNTLEPAKIRIMPLKFLDGHGEGTTAAAINAINYAVKMGAKVINCSWGGGAYSRALHDALTNAYNRGVLIVTAAGNYSSNNDVEPMYPAAYDVPSNVSVAATTDSDRLAKFSNYGATTVHVGAPGIYVYSTVPGDYLLSLSGTSMAAPFVAGAAALAYREAGQISGYQMRSLIMGTGDTTSFLNGFVASSARINVDSLIGASKNMVATQAFQPDYTPVYKAERSPSSDEAGGGAGCGLIRAVSQGAGPGSPGASGMLSVLFGLPVLLWFALRRQAPAKARRFDRFVMNSEIVIRAGDRELAGRLNTISLGGLSFNVDEILEKGGSVQMKIMGPNGGEALEVEGHIVWNERNSAYGVQFDGVQETVRQTLFGWTRNLVRQS